MPYDSIIASFSASTQEALARLSALAKRTDEAVAVVTAAVEQALEYSKAWDGIESDLRAVSKAAREYAARAASEPLYKEVALAAEKAAEEMRRLAVTMTASAAKEAADSVAFQQAREAGLLDEVWTRARKAGARESALAAIAAVLGVELPAPASTAKTERPAKKRAHKAKANKPADKPAAPATAAREAGISNRVALMATWAALQKVATRVERAGDGLARVVFSRLVAGRREIRGVRAAAVKAAAIQAAKAVSVKGRRDAVALANDEAKAWAFAEAFVKALAAQKK